VQDKVTMQENCLLQTWCGRNSLMRWCMFINK